ncbi:MAG: hypothetical protein ACRDO2_04960 [Nocardioidaceae bacterium]
MGRDFYDERLVQRHGAVPEPVRSTLFGNVAVQSLDGAMHRARRGLFLEHPVAPNQLVLLDLYGQHHHPGVWDKPRGVRPRTFPLAHVV